MKLLPKLHIETHNPSFSAHNSHRLLTSEIKDAPFGHDKWVLQVDQRNARLNFCLNDETNLNLLLLVDTKFFKYGHETKSGGAKST